MKISALRVADVGRFRKPVALEGLTDGLNVLAGENELGKSTLFRALLAVFQAPYASKDKAIAALQPYDGGAPLIEVDFVAAEHHWRIRKRFLQRSMAELVDLDTGAVVAKNADVQAKLNDLRAGPSGLERFGLLWIGQGESLEDFRLAPDTATNLRQFVLQEIEGAAADERAHTVHQSVLTRLAALVTAKQGKPTGEYAKAIAECEATERRSGETRARLTAAEARLSALSQAAAEVEQLGSPVSRATRQRVITEAEQAIQKATREADMARSAMDALKAAESAAATARSAYAAWKDQQSRFATTRDEQVHLEQQLTAVREEIERANADIARLTAATDELTARSANLEKERAASRAATEWAAHAAQRDEIANRLAMIKAVTAELSLAETNLRSSAVDDAALKALTQLAAARDRLDHRLTAVAPEVTIDPLPGMASRFAIDGKTLDAPGSFRVRTPLHIDIEGIGRIEVRPGGDATRATDEAERRLLDGELAAQLSALGVPDIEAAGKAAEARHKEERRRDELRARLAGMAPDGLDTLWAAHNELVTATASPPPVQPARGLAEIEQEQAELAIRHRNTHLALTAMIQQLEAARRNEVKAETLIAEKTARLTELATTLGPEADRETHARDLERAKRAADETLAAAARDASAWRAVMANPADMSALAGRLSEARAAEAAAEKRIHDLELDIRGWEAALQADNDVDIEHEAQIAAHEAARARARLTDLQREVAALKQLDAMLAAAFQAERTEVIEPVARRIAPYLQKVLPGASLRIDDALSPAALVRDSRSETLDRISRGTAEQVAVVTRLGLARLLSERKAPAPLILDDALVYADDSRIAALFDALTDAATHHQVIVLTCREKTFADLAGTRVNLTDWRVPS